jgi:hypothetical protein
VSLPWNRAIHLEIGPESVAGRLERTWPRSKVLTRSNHPVATAAGSGGSDAAASWVRSLEQPIAAALADLGPAAQLRGAPLAVHCASFWIRFDVVTGDFSGNSGRELQAVAEACMAELMGDAASTHTIRWAVQPGGRSLLICAMPAGLLALLSQVSAGRGLKLSVQPDFCVQWNRHARAMPTGTGVFAVAAGNEAWIASVEGGVISHVSGGRWLHEAVPASPATVRRLMSGFGLGAADDACMLDVRTDRLLASLGRSTAVPQDFVLVAPDDVDVGLNSRWTVRRREGVHA